jgi:hypothetical protein
MSFDLNRCVVLDLEVARSPEEVEGGWDNPEAMGFASAVVYVYCQDQYYFFVGEEDKRLLLGLLKGKLAVTFNGIKFDSRVLLGNSRNLSTHDGQVAKANGGGLYHWDNYDILLEYVKNRFGCRSVGEAEKKLGDKAIHDGTFGLDGLCQGTLGMGKTGRGSEAPLLYREKKYSELLSYNLHDVRLTRKLFDFIRRFGFVLDREKRVVTLSKGFASLGHLNPS